MEENKKYELTNEKMILEDGTEVFRIRALREFVNSATAEVIESGTLGGYVQSEENLSHNGGCWVEGWKVIDNEQYMTGRTDNQEIQETAEDRLCRVYAASRPVSNDKDKGMEL